MTLAESLKKATPQGPPHLVIEALAGTGKTTTLVEGLKLVKGGKPTIKPSPQQEAVWDSLKLSKGAGAVSFVAFNKSIASELQQRVPEGCTASTMHSLGLKAVTRNLGRLAINANRLDNIIASALDKDLRDVRKNDFELLRATTQLVGLCKMNLTEEGRGWGDTLDQLASYYDVELNGSRDRVYDLVPKVLDLCKDVDRDRQIDFNDMIWLPVVLGLPVAMNDLLLVDECQDLNKCQQALAGKAGRRLVFCGDAHQAIYGFAGADALSMETLKTELGNSPQGCEVLPLTVTRRCGKAIVEEARKIVPAFEAHEDNCSGTLSKESFKGAEDGSNSYMGAVRDGDMCLCRVNAPLVSQCFRFLKDGRKAKIQGRDIGQGLIRTIKKLSATSVSDLVSRLSDYHCREVEKEQAKRNPNENRIITLNDRYDCIMVFTEGTSSVDEVTNKIETIFADDQREGVHFSSIHRAKGLESKRVFLLEPTGATVPHPMAKSAWQKEQEMNLRYVAITRAIEELVYVG